MPILSTLIKGSVGQFEARLFANMKYCGLCTVHAGELADPFGLSSIQANKLLGRPSQGGLIVQVGRGLYFVPQWLPPGGKWIPEEAPDSGS